MQNFSLTAPTAPTPAQLSQAQSDQPIHFVLFEYEFFGWSWIGIGLFDDLESDRYYNSARTARRAAERAIRAALA